jgi:hypothetical protein
MYPLDTNIKIHSFEALSESLKMTPFLLKNVNTKQHGSSWNLAQNQKSAFLGLLMSEHFPAKYIPLIS